MMRLYLAAAFTAGEVGGRERGGFFKVTYRKHVFKRRKPMKLDPNNWMNRGCLVSGRW